MYIYIYIYVYEFVIYVLLLYITISYILIFANMWFYAFFQRGDAMKPKRASFVTQSRPCMASMQVGRGPGRPNDVFTLFGDIQLIDAMYLNSLINQMSASVTLTKRGGGKNRT